MSRNISTHRTLSTQILASSGYRDGRMLLEEPSSLSVIRLGLMDMYDDTKGRGCLTRSRQISGVSLVLGLIKLNLVSHGHGNWHSEQCLVVSRGRPWLHSQIGTSEGGSKSCNWFVNFPAIRLCGTLSHCACQIWTEIYVCPGTCPHAVV